MAAMQAMKNFPLCVCTWIRVHCAGERICTKLMHTMIIIIAVLRVFWWIQNSDETWKQPREYLVCFIIIELEGNAASPPPSRHRSQAYSVHPLDGVTMLVRRSTQTQETGLFIWVGFNDFEEKADTYCTYACSISVLNLNRFVQYVFPFPFIHTCRHTPPNSFIQKTPFLFKTVFQNKHDRLIQQRELVSRCTGCTNDEELIEVDEAKKMSESCVSVCICVLHIQMDTNLIIVDAIHVDFSSCHSFTSQSQSYQACDNRRNSGRCEADRIVNYAHCRFH